jgi:hypothetical protein
VVVVAGEGKISGLYYEMEISENVSVIVSYVDERGSETHLRRATSDGVPSKTHRDDRMMIVQRKRYDRVDTNETFETSDNNGSEG